MLLKIGSGASFAMFKSMRMIVPSHGINPRAILLTCFFINYDSCVWLLGNLGINSVSLYANYGCNSCKESFSPSLK